MLFVPKQNRRAAISRADWRLAGISLEMWGGSSRLQFLRACTVDAHVLFTKNAVMQLLSIMLLPYLGNSKLRPVNAPGDCQAGALCNARLTAYLCHLAAELDWHLAR
jgi:hypothetical protein